MPNHENIERLTEYGNRLKAAGFRVWLSTFGNGYLTYERDGYWGTFQRSEFAGWQHLMPIVPSRENGSSMFIGKPVTDVWSVEAAEQCARATNHNDLVGTQRNHHDQRFAPHGYEL